MQLVRLPQLVDPIQPQWNERRPCSRAYRRRRHRLHPNRTHRNQGLGHDWRQSVGGGRSMLPTGQAFHLRPYPLTKAR